MVFWLFGWFSYLVGECVAHCGWAILGACFMGNARQGAIDQCLDCN